MKYEAPICEIVRIKSLDIIATSGGWSDDTESGDTPPIGIPTLNH